MKSKKLLSVLLAVCLFASVFSGFASAETPGRYKVIPAAAVIFAEPDIASAKLGEVYKDTIVNVDDISRRFGQITVRSTGLTGWVQLANLEYLGAPPSDGTLTGIRVIPPEKLVYTEDGGSIDLTGMKVFAVYSDGLQITVTGYEVFCDSFDSVGEKEIRVTYSPEDSETTYTDSFSVTVERFPVSGLTVVSRPAVTEYMEHAKLDLSGLTVRLTYSDGRPEKLFTYDEMLADGHFTVKGTAGETDGCILSKGQHDFSVTYRYPDISDTFPVSVRARTLLSLTVLNAPNSQVTHSKTKMPDIAGLKLLAEYDNGETEDIDGFDCEVCCDPSSFVLGEGNLVEVRFGGLSVQLSYRLSLNEAVGIRVVPPQKLSFIAGEPIDLTGMKVQLIFADGTLENVTGYEMSEIDPELTGSQNIIVTYGEYSDVFTVSITPYYRKGDINGDGKVEAEDARLALRTSVGYIHLTGLAFTAGDADNDGKITPADARLILRASVKLEKLS